MKKRPVFLKKYFWDVDRNKVDLKKHAADIIGRILEYGDEKAIRWLFKNFSRRQMAEVLARFRFVSPRSAGFWALVLDIPRGRILCLKKHFQKRQRRHWPY